MDNPLKEQSLAMRITRVEKITDTIRAEMDDVLLKAYEEACDKQDQELAAELARKIRNHLLTISDKECAVDRLIPDAPSGTTFTAWIGWLNQLASITKNDWSTYRKKLRDIPTQEGFPFKIDWPTSPDANGNEADNS